jgi:hypothetical protein
MRGRKPYPGKPLSTLAEADRERIYQLLMRVSESRAVDILGTNRLTFGRALAGLPVHKATAHWLHDRLDDYELRHSLAVAE